MSSMKKLNDIVESSFNLGEQIFKVKIVRKAIMRPLPERVRPKVTNIKESKDLDTIEIKELVGSLQTCEFSLPKSKKKKSF